jgi:hypothetical protein
MMPKFGIVWLKNSPALARAVKQGESPFTNGGDASTKSKSGDASSDIVVSQGSAMADLVEDELERARQSLAKNAVRVIELEEQRKRMARPKEISEESEESEEDDDDGEMSESEELAFQMGFNSIEYVTGSVSAPCIPFLMSCSQHSAHGLRLGHIARTTLTLRFSLAALCAVGW